MFVLITNTFLLRLAICSYFIKMSIEFLTNAVKLLVNLPLLVEQELLQLFSCALLFFRLGVLHFALEHLDKLFTQIYECLLLIVHHFLSHSLEFSD